MGTATALKTTTYNIDKAHSEVTFQVRHLLTKVRGRFSDFDGTIEYDDEHPENSQVNVTVQAASIDTNERDRDNHLRSADFFDAARYPTLAFRSRTIVRKGTRRFALTGDLTIHGVTKEVVLDVEGPSAPIKDPWGNQRIGASAATKINRKDFGVNGAPGVVGDEITITIDTELIQPPAK